MSETKIEFWDRQTLRDKPAEMLVDYKNDVGDLKKKIDKLINKGYTCAGANGSQPVNECCGGCLGCVEMQLSYSINDMSTENEKLQATIDDLAKGISFYGDIPRWQGEKIMGDYWNNLDNKNSYNYIGGKTARALQAKYPEVFDGK